MTPPAWHSYYPQVTDVPFEEWKKTIEDAAGWYFHNVTSAAQAAYRQTLRDQSPYYRSPKAERAIREARRRFRAETEGASRLFEETCIELARDREISDEMSERWTALAVPTLMAAE